MRLICSTALFAAALLACPVLAEPPAAPDQNDPALKGPTVTARPPTKGKGASPFGPDSIEKKKTAGSKPTPPPSMSEFMKALEVLRSSSTPEAARVSSEQGAKITAAAAEFEAAGKAYMDKNKAELETLRGKLSPNDRNALDQQLARGGQLRLSKFGFGGKKNVLKQKSARPSADPAMTDASPSASREDAAQVRARVVEIYAGRPKAEDVQAKILGLLTPEQLPLVNAELDKLDTRKAPPHAVKGARALRRHAPVAPKPD